MVGDRSFMRKPRPPRRASRARGAPSSSCSGGGDSGLSRREFITAGATAAAGLLLGCNADGLAGGGADGAMALDAESARRSSSATFKSAIV